MLIYLNGKLCFFEPFALYRTRLNEFQSPVRISSPGFNRRTPDHAEKQIYFGAIQTMRHFLIFFAALLLLTACSDDKAQKQTTETSSDSQVEQIAQQQATPKSLSGSERHAGPNPHARLTTEQHIAVASAHAEEGRIDEALDVLTRAIIESPNDASLIGTRGSMLLAQDRAFDALVDLEKAVSLAPNSALLLVNRSQAYLKFNRVEEAMADLDKAVVLSPQLVPARFNRGTLLYAENRVKEALADFDVCIRVAPETPGPYFNRAVSRDALGDQAGAVDDMNRFIELADNPEWKRVAQETLAAWEKRESSEKQEN